MQAFPYLYVPLDMPLPEDPREGSSFLALQLVFGSEHMGNFIFEIASAFESASYRVSPSAVRVGV